MNPEANVTTPTSEYSAEIVRAAQAITEADAILVAAGAGMGVDSGLPDFRGNEGFWNAYPPFRGRRFAEMSNPVWFERDPAQAWGFFGHRFHLYSTTSPHEGFRLLRQWGEAARLGHFVFTSNVDGQFQKAGFSEDRIVECHGSIHHLQCCRVCSDAIWPADNLTIEVDENTVRATTPLPRCERCDALARPNILMFGDYAWNPQRSDQQQRRYGRWLEQVRGSRFVVIELGAGLAVPTVRYECERHSATLIRINPRDPHVPPGGISLPMGALYALQRIANLLSTR